VDSEKDNQASAEAPAESPKAPAEQKVVAEDAQEGAQEDAQDDAQATVEASEHSPDATPPNASRRRVFVGLGVGAVVIIGAALAMQRTPGDPGAQSGTVAADITLITSDRADVDCSASTGIEPYRCGFSDENMPWHGDEKNKLKPFYTTDRHLYLIPGLFLQPALEARFKAEPPDKPRDLLKRFTAKCHLKIGGKVGGARVRWLSTGAWSNPEEIEVATVMDCKVEG
jgi:hypothetical protein